MYVLLTYMYLLANVNATFTTGSNNDDKNSHAMCISSSKSSDNDNGRTTPFGDFTGTCRDNTSGVILVDSVATSLSTCTSLPVVRNCDKTRGLAGSSSSLSLSKTLAISELILSNIGRVVTGKCRLAVNRGASASKGVAICNNGSKRGLANSAGIVLLKKFCNGVCNNNGGNDIVNGAGMFINKGMGPNRRVSSEGKIFAKAHVCNNNGGNRMDNATGTAVSNGTITHCLVNTNRKAGTCYCGAGVHVRNKGVVGICTNTTSSKPRLGGYGAGVAVTNNKIRTLFNNDRNGPLANGAMVRLVNKAICHHMCSKYCGGTSAGCASVFNIDMPAKLS